MSDPTAHDIADELGGCAACGTCMLHGQCHPDEPAAPDDCPGCGACARCVRACRDWGTEGAKTR